MSEPKDPFDQNEAEAAIMYGVMKAYMDAGFRRAEAFQIFMSFLVAGAQDGTRR